MARIGNKLVATAALAAMIAAGAGVPASAMGPWDGSYYLKGLGGLTIPSDKSADFDNGTVVFDSEASFDTGYMVGAAFGYEANKNFEFELEYGYRRNDIKELRDLAGGKDVKTQTLMLNGYYVIDGIGVEEQWKPYLGLGIGAAQIKMKVSGAEPGLDDFEGSYKRDAALAWQAMAGVKYATRANWEFSGELRYLGTDKGTLDGPDGNKAEMGFDSLDVLFGAAYKF